MLISSSRRFTVALILSLTAMCGVGYGQSSPGDLLRPWPSVDQTLELGATATFFEKGHIKEDDNGTPFQLRQYESAGRYRFRTDLLANPSIGYEGLFLDLKTRNDAVPQNLSDFSIGAASPLHQWENGWYVVAAAGIGYAGEEMFSDSDGAYGKATVLLAKDFDKETSLLFALSYDGNRVLFPDIPLPAIAFTKQLLPELQLAVGFPYNTITFKPIPTLKIEATALIGSLSGKIEYDLSKHFRVYGSFDSFSRAFNVPDLSGHDRLFFEQRRLELGVLWNPVKNLGVTLAGGYAFAQEFSTGFDILDTDKVYKPSDEPYLRFGLVWRP
jgi:hypothetical protein